jgi:hypothetical protein
MCSVYYISILYSTLKNFIVFVYRAFFVIQQVEVILNLCNFKVETRGLLGPLFTALFGVSLRGQVTWLRDFETVLPTAFCILCFLRFTYCIIQESPYIPCTHFFIKESRFTENKLTPMSETSLSNRTVEVFYSGSEKSRGHQS